MNAYLIDSSLLLRKLPKVKDNLPPLAERRLSTVKVGPRLSLIPDSRTEVARAAGR